MLEACESIIKKWRTTPHHLDITRKPLEWGDTFNNVARLNTVAGRVLSKPVKLVVFDLDRTLLQGHKYLWSWTLVWKFLGIPDSEQNELMNRYLNEEKYKNPTWYQDWCNDTNDLFKERKLHRSHFPEITRSLKVVSGFYEVCKTLKENGVTLALVSGGIDVFIDELIPTHGSIFDYTHINRFVFDNVGLLQRIDATQYDFEGKPLAIHEICKKHGWGTNQAVFVGDGFNDEYVLGQVGRVICFNSSSSSMQNRADVSIDGNDLRAILPEIF